MMIAALGALLVATVAMLALPVALRQLIDHGLAAKDAGTINQYFIGFLAAAVIFGAFAALRFYLVTLLGERVVADLRSAVYRRVVRLDPLFFETGRVGEVLARLTTDTALVQAISGVNLSIILRSSLSLIGGLIMLGITSAKLMGVILVLIPVVVVPLIVIGRRVRGLSRASQDRIADTSGLAGETLNAIQTVQAFTLEELQSERYRKAVEDSFVTAVRRTRVRAALTAIGIMLVFAGITFVLWLGAHQVLAGTMTGGQLLQILLYASFVGSSAAALTEMWGEEQRAARAIERLSALPHAPQNVRYVSLRDSDAESEAHELAANAGDFVRKSPQGYHSCLGEPGTRLSGGKRHRIALARAILRDPPILLLDEATSSLDAESKRLVEEALEKLMQGRTTIIIAHRPGTVLKADRLVVMEHGHK